MPNILSNLKQLFKSPQTSQGKTSQAGDTIRAKPLEVPTKPLGTLEYKGSSSSETQLNAGYGQSPGRQRDHNEDALFSLTTMLTFNDTSLPVGLYVVADGMGGHQHGEVASELAIRAMIEHVFKELYIPLFSLSPHPADSSFQEILQAGILNANQAILNQAGGGGTTITAVLIVGEQMTIAHVGDSRVYAVSQEGHLEALTRDHSLVQRLQELGQISPEEAAVHPQRNVLYRALGQGEVFEPELISTTVPSASKLLVCSDGLWNVVDNQKIGAIITSSLTPQAACQELVEAANDAGGPDNISVILVELPT